MSRKLSAKQEKSHKEWQCHLSEWEQSGITQSGYCIKNGLNLRTFQYWRRKFTNPRQRDILSEDNSMVKVVQLQQEKISKGQINIPKSGSGIKLQIGNIFIELDNHFSQDALSRLIKVLKAV